MDCDCCKSGLEEVHKKELEFLKQYGWFAHVVMDDEKMPFGINFHTHGCDLSFKHVNFQICFPISPESAMGILEILLK